MKNVSITNNEVQIMHGVLSKFANKEMPYSIALKIHKNLKVLKPIVDDISEEYSKLGDKYFKKDENGNIERNENGDILLVTSMVEDFRKDEKTLLDFENIVDMYEFTPSDFDKFAITPNDIDGLEKILEE